jgi:hypothetical protein
MGKHSAKHAYQDPSHTTVPMTHLTHGQHNQIVRMAAINGSTVAITASLAFAGVAEETRLG